MQRRLRISGHCWRIAGSPRGMRPPFSFVLPKENAPRPVEKKNAKRDLCSAKVRPGVSSDPANWIWKSPAGCAGHCADSVLLRRKSKFGRSSGCGIEKPLRFGPGRSASLRPTAAVIVYCPGMRGTRGKRRTVLSVFHPDNCRTSATCGGKPPNSRMFSAPGRRLPDFPGSV